VGVQESEGLIALSGLLLTESCQHPPTLGNLELVPFEA